MDTKTLVKLVNKYPITKYLLPHLEGISVQAKTGCSRIDVVVALSGTDSKCVYEIMDTCAYHELSKLLDIEGVVEWFIHSYHNKTRDIDDFFAVYSNVQSDEYTVHHSAAPYKQIMYKYMDAVINPTNEEALFEYGRTFMSASELIGRYGNQGLYDNNYISTDWRSYAHKLLYLASRVSEDRLVMVARYILNSTVRVDKNDLYCTVATTDGVPYAVTIKLLNPLREHLGVVTSEVITYRPSIKPILMKLYHEEV